MFSKRGESPLELAVNRAIRELGNYPMNSEEYVKTLDQLVRLHKMKEDEKSSLVSKDTLVLAGTNLLGIIMIIRHEHVNVIMSRAVGLLLKPR